MNVEGRDARRRTTTLVLEGDEWDDPEADEPDENPDEPGDDRDSKDDDTA